MLRDLDIPGATPDLDLLGFAELSARLDDPFADRTAVLDAAGLDERAFTVHRARCLAQLAGASEGRLRAFGDAYAGAALRVTEARRGAGAILVAGDLAPQADPRFLSAEAQPWREQAASVALSAPAASAPEPVPRPPSPPAPPLAPPASLPPVLRAPPALTTTADVGALVPRAATPFAPSPAPLSAPPAVSLPPVLRAPAALTGTAEVGAIVPRAATPFAPAPVAAPAPAAVALPPVVRAPAALTGTADISAFVPRAATPFTTPPARRFVRFDPQTGQPLAEPRWEDFPAPAPSDPSSRR